MFIFKAELRSNDLTIQDFCFETAIYCLNVYRGNPRDGYRFHQQNNDKRIKANEDPDFRFCGRSEKSHFEWLHKEPF